MRNQELRKSFSNLLSCLNSFNKEKEVESSNLDFTMYLKSTLETVKTLSDQLDDIIGKSFYRGYESYLVDFPESCPSWSYWRKPGEVFIVKGTGDHPSYLPGNYFDVEICKYNGNYYICVYEDTEFFCSVNCINLEDAKIRIQQLEENTPIDWQKLEKFGYKYK